MLNWAARFNICCLLDNNYYPSSYHQYEAILGADAIDTLQLPAGNAFNALLQFYDSRKDWLFGHLAYDLKNEVVPSLHSQNPDGTGFPDLFFFQPRIVMLLEKEVIAIGMPNATEEDAHAILLECLGMPATVADNTPPVAQPLQAHLDHDSYIAAVKSLQQHILRGDCYEVNFCRENFITNASVYPPALYARLSALSPAPFAAYYRLNDKYMVCSSPERFIQKKGRQIISQPIKGTSRKDADPATDEALKKALFNNAKERAENVMVVDLVRNDLSHAAIRGSVHVRELFGIYSFAQVHHMISTVAATLPDNQPFTEVLRHAFPMGSMTGAPKKSVMELIESHEKSRRGLYSGAVGYITPEGDFDFNVVIRSILYNATARYLSFQTGSAITFYSDPEKEWEECLLKAAALRKVLSASETTAP
ncbi:anthranilate synthase component I family protein [Chitinophaga sp. sic0106]|uniref:anthranilate synthase component I family protein n=1 Tax=Chitinophaga sp. sic0106 TaxID=2854785 RepID=UPI001C48EF5F|nr:anthranilate synthase component I family protein [Chitinophaga sp. sic0106]MBV7533348.1 anthranilate synthase component I family protein [Chitinophaga sp. sic0106]